MVGTLIKNVAGFIEFIEYLYERNKISTDDYIDLTTKYLIGI